MAELQPIPKLTAKQFFKQIFEDCHDINTDQWQVYEKAALNALVAQIIVIQHGIRQTHI